MPNTFPIGSVPPFTAWEGETLVFNVKSGLGDGVRFTKRATPSPKGKMTLDEKSGAFSYTPAPEDRDDIEVWFWARNGTKDEKQKVVITPHPRLPPEFKIIRHEANEPKTSEYTTFVEQPDDAPSVFNNTLDYVDKDEAKVKVKTSQVTISGIDLVLESASKTYPLFERLRGRTNLRRLTLCADTITVRNELRLPGTEVHVYARVLRFEEKGVINTTPLSVTAKAQERDEALRGQKGGDVYLYVQKLEESGVGKRIVATGGDGQPAREGKVGQAGHVVTEWDGKGHVDEMVVYKADLDFSGDIRDKAGDYKPLFAEVFAKTPWQQSHVGYDEAGTWGTKDWPTDGHPPEKLPGYPGHGGDGGSVFTALADQLNNRVNLGAGEPGRKAENVPPSAAGKPARSCHTKVYWQIWVIPPTYPARSGESAWVRRKDATITEKREVKPGAGATAPGVNTARPAAKPGAVKPLAQAGPGHWIHPATVRAILTYGHDAFLSGIMTDARKKLADYRDWIEAAELHKTGDILWSGLHGEVAAMVERIDGPYDYFGNPAGWVPILSLESNLKLYESEIESAIRTMFLSFWLGNVQRDKTSAADTLRAALTRLEEETNKATADYNAALSKLTELATRLSPLKAEMDAFHVSLKTLEERLEKDVKGDLQMEHFLRSTGKLLGGVMQLIPAGQPMLGAFGKGLTALSDIDLEKPFSSVPDVLGAFSEVAQEKLLPKAKGLFDKFKNYLDEDAPQEKPKPKKEGEEKKDEEKDKFDKEVAKKKFNEKVKKYMDEQKEAKSQALKAFKGYAVPEDEVKERLARVISECPQYKELVKQLEPLNQKKAAYMQETLAALQTIDEATATMVQGQLARIEMRGQLDKKLEELSPEVFQYAREIGQRARARLLKYQYYLLKAYHFLMLKDLPALDFRAQAMFDAFAKYLPGQTALKPSDPDYLPPSVQGDLTEKHYKRLSAVFEDQLRGVIDTIINYYVSNPPKYDGKFDVELTKTQLETLNAHGRLDIDLMQMGYHDYTREDVRIIDIKAAYLELANPPTEGLVNVSLTYRHEGVSRLRRGGQLYLFRSGRYRVASDGKGDGDEYRDDKMYWGTDATYKSRTKEIEPTHRKPDEVEKWLLKHLLGENDKRDTSPLTSFRPSAWARLTITHSATPDKNAGKLSRLELKVSYASHNLSEKLGTIHVRVSTDVQPLVALSATDVNGLADGQGSFLRTFDTTKTPRVTLRAPERYGQRPLVGWLIDEKPLSERIARINPFPLWWLGEKMEVYDIDSKKIHREPSLVLDFDKQTSYTVEPFYEPLNFGPVNDKGEEWPSCPAGWAFVDWMFVNGTRSELTISQIRIGKIVIPAQVNEPQGGLRVKLSFERLNLPPGEATKLSVSLAPAAPQLIQVTEFEFQAGGSTYHVNFDMKGYPSSFKKDGNLVLRSFDMDRDNRVLTFARP